MFYKGRNVLVFQGGKIFGRCLISKLLDQAAAVRTTFEPGCEVDLKHKNLEIVPCDLSRAEETEKVFKDIDIVFMTANRSAGAKVLTENPSSLFLNNIQIQPRLMHWAVKSKVQRVGFISSSCIYPDTPTPNVEEEGFLGSPQEAIYGIGWCFRYLETLCRHFQMTSSTKFAMMRPAAYYGPYDNFDPESAFVIPSLILKCLKRTPVLEVWGNGKDIRCFTYVDDLMEGFMSVVENYAVAQGINICTHEPANVMQVLSCLFEILDYHPEIRFMSDKPSTVSYKVSDPGKAAKLLDWRAKVSLKEGLKRTVEWYTKTGCLLQKG